MFLYVIICISIFERRNDEDLENLRNLEDLEDCNLEDLQEVGDLFIN